MSLFRPFAALLIAAVSALSASAAFAAESYSMILGIQPPVHATVIATLGASDGRTYHVYSNPSGGAILCGGAPTCARVFLQAASLSGMDNTIPATGFLSISSAAVDSQNRLLIAGTVQTTTRGKDFRVLRLLPSLALDASFGSGGRVDIDFDQISRPRNDDYGTAVAVDGSDNVIIAGQIDRTDPGDVDFGIVKLRAADGAPLTSFGSGGRRIVHFDLGSTVRADSPRTLAVDSSGRITVVGIAIDGSSGAQRVAMARLMPNGDFDETLCHNGCAYNTYPNIQNGRQVYFFGSSNPHADEPQAVAVASSGGRFAVVGHRTNNGNGNGRRAMVAIFDADGTMLAERGSYIDPTNLLNDADYTGVRFQPRTGTPTHVLLAGILFGGSAHFVQRLNVNSLGDDTQFGDCGSDMPSVLCVGAAEARVAGLTLDASGRGLVAVERLNAGVRRYEGWRVGNATSDAIFINGFELP